MLRQIAEKSNLCAVLRAKFAFAILAVIFAIAATNDSLAQSIPDKFLQKPNTPVVLVNGFVNFTASDSKQNNDYSKQKLPDENLASASASGTPNQNSSQYDVENDNEIYVKIGAISDSGLKYGIITELEADSSFNTRSNAMRLEKSFLFAESKIGKFEVGNNLAANQKMKVGPSIFARATGGISGKYLEHINSPMLANSSQITANGGVAVCDGGVGSAACGNIKLPNFILVPQSPIGHGGYAKGFYNYGAEKNYAVDDIADHNNSANNNAGNFMRYGSGLNYKNGSFGQTEDATKLSYYTPRINGWQGGASFTPSTNNNQQFQIGANNNFGYIKNIFSWALNYSNYFNNLGFAVSATGEHGQFQNAKYSSANSLNTTSRQRLNSYDVGAMLTYFGFTFGASYGYWGNSLQANNGVYSCDYNSAQNLSAQNCSVARKKFNGASYYSGGAAYEFGPLAASFTFFASEFQKNKYQAQSFGIDYKMARGLMPYVEITRFKFEANQPQAANINTANVQIKNNAGYVGLVGFLLAF